LLLNAHQIRLFVVVGVVGLLLGACSAHPPDPDEFCPDCIGQVQQGLSCGGLYPATPSFLGLPIDGFASYDEQDQCDPTIKDGLFDFRELILATYPCTTDLGITRGCSVGGASEHKEGRAWDWGVTPDNQASADVLAWLLATDSDGNKYAIARRLGLMYMIFDSKIWGAYRADEGWRPYNGASPHTDHVHFSFSWDGALKKTSYWSGTVLPPDASVDSAPPSVDAGPEADSLVSSDHQIVGGADLPPLYSADSGVSLPQPGCAVADVSPRGLSFSWLLAFGAFVWFSLRRKAEGGDLQAASSSGCRCTQDQEAEKSCLGSLCYRSIEMASAADDGYPTTRLGKRHRLPQRERGLLLCLTADETLQADTGQDRYRQEHHEPVDEANVQQRNAPGRC